MKSFSVRALLASAIIIGSLSLLPHTASAAVVNLAAGGLTSTSTNAFSVSNEFATTTRAKSGDVVQYQLTLDGTPNATTTPTINIQGMGTSTMTNDGTYKYFYATTTSSAWNTGAVAFYIAFGGSLGESTTTISQSSLTGSNVYFDKTAPTLASPITWADTDGNGSTEFTAGDTLTLTFNETMATTTIASTTLDTVLPPSTAGHSWGTSPVTISWNTAGTRLVVTLNSGTSITGADTITPTSAVKDLVGNSYTSSSAIVLLDAASPATPTGINAQMFHGSKTVGIESAGSSKILYTLDGSTPSCPSTGTVYTEPLVISNPTMVSAIACDEAGNYSAVVSGMYSPASGGSEGASGSGGGGGGGSISTPATPVVSSTPATQEKAETSTTSESPAVAASGLSASQIQSILDVLASFDADAATIAGVKASLLGTTAGSMTSAAVQAFKSNLTLGSLGSEVKALQHYLNANGFTVATSGSGSAGNETTTFGAGTRAALAKFQKAHGITPANGYFGPKTRSAVNANQ